MTLLSPWTLALLAILLPILWLLHFRARNRVHPVGNLFLWREAIQETEARSRERRRERAPLFLLDALFLAALVLALARPVAIARGRAIALVVDVSLSMGAVEGSGTRLDLARAEAQALLDGLDPRDAVLVVEAGPAPRVVLDLTRDRNAARDALRRLEPTGAGARLEDALPLAFAKLGEGGEVVIFSDGITRIRPERKAPSVRTIAVGAASDNLAVSRLAARAISASSVGHEIFVEVRSFADEERTVPLQLGDDRGTFFETSLRIPPGGSRGTIVERHYLEETVVEAAIEGRDALPLDDRAYALVGPRAPTSVLLVTRGNRFLEAALSSHAAFRTAVVSPEVYAEGAASAEVVVLDRASGNAGGDRTLLVHGPADKEGDGDREAIEVLEPRHPVLALVDFGEVTLSPVAVPVSRGDRILASAGGSPLLVASVSERGRRLHMSGALLEGAFPLTPSFPILIWNAVRWLSGEDESSSTLVAGERGTPDRPGVYRVRRGTALRRVAVAAPVETESDLARERSPDPEPTGAPGVGSELAPRGLHPLLLLAGIGILAVERCFGRLRLAWAAMAITLSAVVLPAIPFGRRLEPLVIVLDDSESVSAGSGRKFLQAIDEILESEAPRGAAGVVVFGRDAWIERPLGRESTQTTAVGSRVERGASNLEAGLRLAGAMLSGDEGGRILLASDGNETFGEAARTSAALRSRGLTVDAFPLPAGHRADFAALEVEAPPLVRVGEPFEIAVTIDGRAGSRGVIELRSGEGTRTKREIVLKRDREVVRFSETLRSTGIHLFSAHPGPGAGVLVRAFGRPRVLHVSGDGKADSLARALARQGYDVDSVGPSSVSESSASLSPYDAVFFADVPARSFREPQMAAIAEYVERAGGGFLMVGESGSFGPGGYAGTPIEPILPVDVRGGGGKGSVGVVLVIDKSGSMGGDGSGPSKIDAARNAAIGVERLLGPQDILGAIAFDRVPHTVLPLRSVGKGEALGLSVATLGAQGGTVAYDAVALARAWLRDVDVTRRHIILVSDGELEKEDAQRIIDSASGGDAIVSVIGIGADVDRERLSAIANAAGGEAVFVPGADATPGLLAREALRLTGSPRVEREAPVRLREPHPIARGIDAEDLPILTAYAATAMRETAATIVATDRDEPVVAAWNAGMGKSVALTSSDLGRWDSFGRLWLQAVRWASRRVGDPSLDPRAVVDEGRALLVVDARGAEGAFLNGLEARARVRPPPPRAESFEVPLSQTAPGLYQGHFDLVGPGPYLVNASAAAPDGAWEESVPLGFYVSSAMEHRAFETDLPRLHEIARLGGGRVLREPREILASRKIVSAKLDVFRPLTALALLVFLVHVARRHGFRVFGT